MNNSNINERLAELQTNDPIQFILFGDSIYPNLSHIRRKHEAEQEAVLDANQKKENSALNAGRTSIEWINNDLKTKWAFIDYKKCLKLRQAKLKNVILYCVLLTNMYKCLYGCQTSSYFNLNAPELEVYMNK